MRKSRLFLVLALTVAMCLAGVAQAGQRGDFALLNQINVTLQQMGANFRVYMAETVTSGEANEIGQTVYAKNVGNKQLSAHFVPCDQRRFGLCDISWAVDATEGATASGLTNADTEPAIDRAMATWNSVSCSHIPLSKVDDYGLDLGYVQYLVGLGGVPGWLADYTHAGWLPRLFFDTIAPPDGGDYILGVTFTFIWVDDVTGIPTDIDRNGKNDVAFRETYYNDRFLWRINATVDVESIVLHEAGHGISQAHFGKVFVTDANGTLHFAPRAVMNAVYAGGVLQTLTGTDVAGHCSIWATWPNH